MSLRTCVTPRGRFSYGVHIPSYTVDNLRQEDHLLRLGRLPDGAAVMNQANFPDGEVRVEQASTVYEIPNVFPFRGTTFIDDSWAGPRAADPSSIRLEPAPEMSMTGSLRSWARHQHVAESKAMALFQSLPAPVLLALATTSTDPRDLITLAHLCCEFAVPPGGGEMAELAFTRDEQGRARPMIHDRDLFEAVANNPALPDQYKEVMVLRPGAQGGSEVVGDIADSQAGSRVFEYLRRNSYIPWGHYAANMAHGSPRYRIGDLSLSDMQGLRHLYYQRTLVRLARETGWGTPRAALSVDELEALRLKVLKTIQDRKKVPHFRATLWGWNFGFDFAPTGYRLHASHQQIHQQNAMIPGRVRAVDNGDITGSEMDAFACGDMVAETVRAYREQTGQDLFADLIRCIRSNRRTNGRDGPESLIVFEDEHVLLFAPKAQVSQWELQLMTLGPVGNILEADTACRASLDRGLLMALLVLESMGARMVTSIEFSKRFTDPGRSQRLLYSFLPRLPWSPGSFSEAQHRFINGHYPEDFAQACRMKLDSLLQT
jgi:hypothetical protein